MAQGIQVAESSMGSMERQIEKGRCSVQSKVSRAKHKSANTI